MTVQTQTKKAFDIRHGSIAHNTGCQGLAFNKMVLAFLGRERQRYINFNYVSQPWATFCTQ